MKIVLGFLLILSLFVFVACDPAQETPSAVKNEDTAQDTVEITKQPLEEQTEGPAKPPVNKEPKETPTENNEPPAESEPNENSAEENSAVEQELVEPTPPIQPEPSTQQQSTRPFSLGFTPWPPDLTVQAVDDAYQFIQDHGDIVAHHMDNGVPWQESLDGTEYSAHLQEDFERRTSKTPTGHKIYLAITPIAFDREHLATYWGESDGMDLPDEWKNKKFNDPDVKTAYLNYAKRSIEHFDPDYLAIGIEVNAMISKKAENWEDYVELNAYVYDELKKEHPDLIIFSTVQYEFLKGIEEEAHGDEQIQQEGVAALLKHSDLLALSTYRYGLKHNPMTEDYFDLALSFDKPLAIAEMGVMSRDTKISWITLKATDEDQDEFMNAMLQKATDLDFAFVINFVAIDYDKFVEKLPKSVQQASLAWVHTGLKDQDYQDKQALSTWDEYLALEKTD